MTERKSNKVAAALKRKGFRLARQTDHEFYELYLNEKKTGIHTHVSHGKKQIHSAVLSQMAKQLKLSNKELKDLLDCPLDFDGLIEILQSKNFI